MEVQITEGKRDILQGFRRAAGYARVSVDEWYTRTSAETQEGFLKKKISTTPGWVDCGVFSDIGYSGTNTDRPGFTALMDKCEEGKIDLIITKSISRFCRNTVDLLTSIRHLKEIGVEVIFDENGISTFSSAGELMITLLASQAEEESRSISENVLWSFSKMFERGEGIPSQMMGYRWDGKEYRIVEKEAETVRRIFSMYLDGCGRKAIASALNAEGVTGILGKPMTEQTVGTILRQEKYTGDSVLQKTFTENHITHIKVINRGEKDRYLVEGTHPPIIERETFDKVQEEMERRRSIPSIESNRSVKTSVFTSKIICADCGRTFRRKVNRREKYPDYARWVCGEKFDRRNGGCRSKAIPEWVLYETAAEIIGKDDFTQEEFSSGIERIIAGKDHEAVFELTDGSSRTVTWKNRRWQDNGR
ncbi:MAG: recombinase family protein [Bullifex sp.]